MKRLPAPLLTLLGASAEAPSLVEALTHPSFANERKSGPRVDYQRLEFLGDAVLQLVVSDALFRRYPEAAEGELSRMRASIVRTESLAEFARSVKLGEALRVGRGAESSGDREQAPVLADAFEAVIGAVFHDAGFEAARSLIERFVAAAVDERARLRGRDPKSALQERTQSGGNDPIVYRVVETSGPGHRPEFVVEVALGDRVLGQGRGSSKKLAEQAAAEVALASLTTEHDGPARDASVPRST